MKNYQIVFTERNRAELLEAEYTRPGEKDVVAELEYSAVSPGTEKASITGLRVGKFAEGTEPVFPRYGGYSAAGIVRETGSAVTRVKEGDRVVVFWGAHKKAVTIGCDRVIKIPDKVSTEEASLSLIAAFPLAAIRKTKLEIGESALVMGLGALGQFAVMEARAAGAVPVIAADPVAGRREAALRLGADAALDPAEDGFPDRVKALTGGGVSVAVEATGLGRGMVQALDCMRRFGRIALLGCTRSSDFTVDYYTKVHMPGISIVGAHTMARPTESFPGYWTEADDIRALLALIRGGRLNFRDLIGEIHSPKEAPKVYERLIHDPNFPAGVLFDWKSAGLP